MKFLCQCLSLLIVRLQFGTYKDINFFQDFAHMPWNIKCDHGQLYKLLLGSPWSCIPRENKVKDKIFDLDILIENMHFIYIAKCCSLFNGHWRVNNSIFSYVNFTIVHHLCYILCYVHICHVLISHLFLTGLLIGFLAIDIRNLLI